jgi:hypothetical protein
MASTTATALIGITHPNDSLICPSHLARLIEGDAACWVLNSLKSPARPVTWRCTSSDRAFPDLLGLIVTNVFAERRRREEKPSDLEIDRAVERDHPRFALSLTVFPESSLRGALAELDNLANVDLDLSVPVWSKKWSAWSDTISVEGSIPGRATAGDLHG